MILQLVVGDYKIFSLSRGVNFLHLVHASQPHWQHRSSTLSCLYESAYTKVINRTATSSTMKSYTLVVLVVACLIFEQTMARPEKTMQEKAQELLDKVKASAQEAAEHAQESAARALESAKTVVHDAVHSAQETGREWVEHGKSIAAGFSNQTIAEAAGKATE